MKQAVSTTSTKAQALSFPKIKNIDSLSREELLTLREEFRRIVEAAKTPDELRESLKTATKSIIYYTTLELKYISCNCMDRHLSKSYLVERFVADEFKHRAELAKENETQDETAKPESATDDPQALKEKLLATTDEQQFNEILETASDDLLIKFLWLDRFCPSDSFARTRLIERAHHWSEKYTAWGKQKVQDEYERDERISNFMLNNRYYPLYRKKPGKYSRETIVSHEKTREFIADVILYMIEHYNEQFAFNAFYALDYYCSTGRSSVAFERELYTLGVKKLGDFLADLGEKRIATIDGINREIKRKIGFLDEPAPVQETKAQPEPASDKTATPEEAKPVIRFVIGKHYKQISCQCDMGNCTLLERINKKAIFVASTGSVFEGEINITSDDNGTNYEYISLDKTTQIKAINEADENTVTIYGKDINLGADTIKSRSDYDNLVNNITMHFIRHSKKTKKIKEVTLIDEPYYSPDYEPMTAALDDVPEDRISEDAQPEQGTAEALENAYKKAVEEEEQRFEARHQREQAIEEALKNAPIAGNFIYKHGSKKKEFCFNVLLIRISKDLVNPSEPEEGNEVLSICDDERTEYARYYTANNSVVIFNDVMTQKFGVIRHHVDDGRLCYFQTAFHKRPKTAIASFEKQLKKAIPQIMQSEKFITQHKTTKQTHKPAVKSHITAASKPADSSANTQQDISTLETEQDIREALLKLSKSELQIFAREHSTPKMDLRTCFNPKWAKDKICRFIASKIIFTRRVLNSTKTESTQTAHKPAAVERDQRVVISCNKKGQFTFSFEDLPAKENKAA